MRAEIDISLDNPIESISLTSIEELVINNNTYRLLHHVPNNYLLIQNDANDYKIRVHEDGRIYVKTNFDYKNGNLENAILEKLLSALKQFISTINRVCSFVFRNEFNFSFYGATAHSFFWKKYDELNDIGNEYLINYDLRTFAQDDDSIHVKLESFGSMTTFSS